MLVWQMISATTALSIVVLMIAPVENLKAVEGMRAS
jgi:hypothetical protein